MIGADQFEQMRDGVVFLNTARAQLHDTDALVAALRSGKVSAAGLDHFVGEHLPVDHPLVGMDNVVLTPHIGGATYDTEANHSRLVADDLARLLAGERPVHIVNPEVCTTCKRSRAMQRRVESTIKQQVLAAAKDMLRKGLTEGTAGNISARLPDGNVVITPSSVDYEAMTLDDLCVIDLDANVLEGTRGPSSEKLLHLACYKGFDDIQSVIHAHPDLRHDVRGRARADPRVHRRVRHLRRRRRGGDRLRDERHRRRRQERGDMPAGAGRRPARQPRHGGGRSLAGQGAAHHRAHRAQRADRVGCPRPRARCTRCPTR